MVQLIETSQLVTVGFTATRDVEEEELLRLLLFRLLPEFVMPGKGLRFITGGAKGGDTIIGNWLWKNYPIAKHMVIVPADTRQVDWWWPDQVEEVRMPEGTTFKDRNQAIVAHTKDDWPGGISRFYGFPAYQEKDPRSIRSGSWQTLRMAKKAKIPGHWWSLKDKHEGKLI